MMIDDVSERRVLHRLCFNLPRLGDIADLKNSISKKYDFLNSNIDDEIMNHYDENIFFNLPDLLNYLDCFIASVIHFSPQNWYRYLVPSDSRGNRRDHHETYG